MDHFGLTLEPQIHVVIMQKVVKQQLCLVSTERNRYLQN